MISYEARHRFANKTAPGLLLAFPDYVVDEDTEREFWFEIETGGSKSYAVLKAAHDERERVRSVRAQALELANAAADANRSGNEKAEGDESAGGAEADDEADNPSETATPTQRSATSIPSRRSSSRARAARKSPRRTRSVCFDLQS